MRLWVFLLWHGTDPLKVPFSSLPTLFIYLSQDCSVAQLSVHRAHVSPSWSSRAWTNIPGSLFILPYVPLLLNSVHMYQLICHSLCETWLTFEQQWVTLPFLSLAYLVACICQYNFLRISCMSLFMWYTPDLHSWGPPFIFRFQKNDWGPAHASYSGTALLFKKKIR